MNVVKLSGKILRGLLLFVAYGAMSATAQETNLPPTIGFGEGWRYWNREMAPMAGWKSLEYNDSVWTSGTAQLGYEDGDEATVTRLEPVPPHPVTAYFRKHFFLGSPAQFTKAEIRLIRDDGAVVYINGVEVVRDGMPGGEVGHNRPSPDQSLKSTDDSIRTLNCSVEFTLNSMDPSARAFAFVSLSAGTGIRSRLQRSP